MKVTFSSFIATATLIASSISPVAAVYRGFNLGANNNQGACKVTSDYMGDFAKIKSWPGGFNAVRLYSTSDCNQLDQAAPAAIQYGMKILVGVWTEDDTHFNNEVAALRSAISKYGKSWIAAISVGSEDLYRNEASPQVIAQKIGTVRSTVNDRSIMIGHTDTWTAWVNGANDVVTKACDFIISDGYPYWQGSTLQQANAVFYQSVSAVQQHLNSINSKVAIWIGETGWPTGGANFGASIPSTTNAKGYWRSVGCQLIRQNTNFFWYSAFDAPTAAAGVEQHFGVAYPGRTLKFSLNC